MIVEIRGRHADDVRQRGWVLWLRTVAVARRSNDHHASLLRKLDRGLNSGASELNPRLRLMT